MLLVNRKHDILESYLFCFYVNGKLNICFCVSEKHIVCVCVYIDHESKKKIAMKVTSEKVNSKNMALKKKVKS